MQAAKPTGRAAVAAELSSLQAHLELKLKLRLKLECQLKLKGLPGVQAPQKT